MDPEVSRAAHDRRVGRPRRGAHGFTLIEVMIAMVVMVIGLTGVMMMQAAAVRGNREAGRYTRCAMLAEEVMEQLRGRSVAVLEANEGVTIAPLEVNGVTYDVSYSVVDIAAQPNLVMVTVTATYADEGDNSDTEYGKHTATVQMIRTRLEAL